jgi:SNF2 family DNA or RNA helicase
MKLWQHQQEAVDEFANRTNYGLFFDTGTGKTGTTVHCYLEKARQHGEHLRTLILSPNNVLENWKREFETFAGIGNRVLVLKGSGDQRIKQLKNTNCNIVVTNHQALTMRSLFDLFMKMPIDLLVFDELHRIKNPTGVWAKNAHKLADKSKYRLGLTGTPILNSYVDLWSQIRFLNKELVGDNFFAWRKKHFFNANAGKHWLSFPDYQPKPESL